jgi:hypothetical protein
MYRDGHDVDLPVNATNILKNLLYKGLNSKSTTELCWCISNMAAAAPQGYYIYQEFAGILGKILSETSDGKVTIMALNALRNIAGDCVENRNFVLDTVTLAPIVKIIEKHMIFSTETDRQVVKAGLMVCTALTRKKPAPPMNKTSALFIKPNLLPTLLASNDMEIVEEVLWTYSGLTEQSQKENLSNIGKSVNYRRLVELSKSPLNNISYVAYRGVGNLMVSDDESITMRFVENGVLDVLKRNLEVKVV